MTPSKYFSGLKVWQWIALVLVLGFFTDWLIQRPDTRTRELNQTIETQGSAELKAYPYRFRVVRVEGSTAVMATPRNFDVPAFRFIAIIHPDIDVKNTNNPAYAIAQAELARVQSEANRLVESQPGIKSVRWELDKHWLASHGVDVPVK